MIWGPTTIWPSRSSHANFWRYIAGLAAGVIPKTLIVALLGQSVLSAMGGGMILAIGVAVTVVGIWITVALAARRAVRGDKAPAEAAVDAPAEGKAEIRGGGP
mgnify:CR=1 FL=1